MTINDILSKGTPPTSIEVVSALHEISEVMKEDTDVRWQMVGDLMSAQADLWIRTFDRMIEEALDPDIAAMRYVTVSSTLLESLAVALAYEQSQIVAGIQQVETQAAQNQGSTQQPADSDPGASPEDIAREAVVQAVRGTIAAELVTALAGGKMFDIALVADHAANAAADAMSGQ